MQTLAQTHANLGKHASSMTLLGDLVHGLLSPDWPGWLRGTQVCSPISQLLMQQLHDQPAGSARHS